MDDNARKLREAAKILEDICKELSKRKKHLFEPLFIELACDLYEITPLYESIKARFEVEDKQMTKIYGIYNRFQNLWYDFFLDKNSAEDSLKRYYDCRVDDFEIVEIEVNTRVWHLVREMKTIANNKLADLEAHNYILLKENQTQLFEEVKKEISKRAADYGSCV